MLAMLPLAMHNSMGRSAVRPKGARGDGALHEQAHAIAAEEHGVRTRELLPHGGSTPMTAGLDALASRRPEPRCISTSQSVNSAEVQRVSCNPKTTGAAAVTMALVAFSFISASSRMIHF